MTIKRIHSDNGIEFKSKNELAKVVKRELKNKAPEPELLGPGFYNLTPKVWTRHLHNHQLIVHENGTALYLTIPREEGVGIAERESREFREGGRKVAIPEEVPLIMIAGPKSGKGGKIFLFEMVYWEP